MELGFRICRVFIEHFTQITASDAQRLLEETWAIRQVAQAKGIAIGM